MFMSAFVRTRAHSDFWNRVSPNAKSNKKYQIRFDKIEHCNSEAIRYIINIQFRGNHEMFHEDQRSSISWSASTPDLGNPPDISKYLEKFSPAALISDWTIAGGKGWISAEEFISFRLRFVNSISFQIILSWSGARASTLRSDNSMSWTSTKYWYGILHWNGSLVCCSTKNPPRPPATRSRWSAPQS